MVSKEKTNEQKMAACHPGEAEYALDMCYSCYRKKFFSTDYNNRQFGDRMAEYRQAYEKTDKARERRRRYYAVRKAIGVTLNRENPLLSEVFNSDEDLKKLRAAMLAGDRNLTTVWLDLSEEQQDSINRQPLERKSP